jgi:predicted DNA-binding protein (MmcQ/YjbR family)
MNIEEFRDYCIAKEAVTEELPFGPTTLVFKVMGKMFALTSLDTEDFRVNLKCDPEIAAQLREEYDFVLPGFHMNKTHWNTILVENGATTRQLQEWTDHSYNLVAQSLTKKQKELLQQK